MNEEKKSYWVNAGIALVIGLVMFSGVLGWLFVNTKQEDEPTTVIGLANDQIKSDSTRSSSRVTYLSIKPTDADYVLSERFTPFEQYLISIGIPENQIQISSALTNSLKKQETNGADASDITGYSLSQEKISSQSGRDNKSRIYQAEVLLSNLGYWITKADSVADSSTKYAIIAFQKVEGRKRTGLLTEDELQAMRLASRPAPRLSGAAYIEVDITRQVLFLVDDNGTVTRILPVSTGSNKRYIDKGKRQTAYTPRGNFQITRQINGIRHASLGNLYYPSYFDGGVAIHGSNSVPVYPASHGCVRIPNFAAKEFVHLAQVKMPVRIYN